MSVQACKPLNIVKQINFEIPLSRGARSNVLLSRERDNGSRFFSGFSPHGMSPGLEHR